ncbi:MAG TPA: TetR family transcriptional regulator C-terminal domain-containing protein [Kineosporiaceae bacterium]|nr:TetR family transcriptional regulator C-terminal domain-containing protein [Kineosporiaceae bacterium]
MDERTRRVLGESLQRPDLSLADVIRAAANLNFEGLKNEPAMRLQQALWSQHATDPEVRDRVGALYVAISQALVPLYSALLDRSRRRMKPPYDVENLAVVLAALVEGLVVRWSVDPDAVPDDLGPPPGVEPVEGEPWGTFASITYLIFMAMTEPITRPSDEAER